MTNVTSKLIAAALISGLSTSAAIAQQTTVFDTRDSVADQVDDLNESIQDEFQDARDTRSFGPDRLALGWGGSVSATGSATSGNTDTADIGVGARLTYSDGTNGHEFALSYQYGEDDGASITNTLAASYDYTRSFNRDFYGFAEVNTKYDEFGSYVHDDFIGVGLGYRIVNTRQTTWSLQAGPGWRYLEDASGAETDEAAWTVGSKLFHRINDDMFVSNDTTFLISDSDTAISNDLGLSVAMSKSLALRTSLRTEYHSDPLPGLDDVDNTFGVSLVYAFD